MKIGIDSYCFHRYFGETYPFQRPTERRWTVDDFLTFAQRMGVDGVSLESCFFPKLGTRVLKKVRARLDALGFERVWAWGHPAGLEGGKSKRAANDLAKHFGYAQAIGAKTMRIVGGNRSHRDEPIPRVLRRLAARLKELVKVAEDHGVVMAYENHIDLRADELLELLAVVDSPWLGVNLDTGNNIRLGEDPADECRKLAPFTRATHVKDIGIELRGKCCAPKEFAFWPSVPLGTGLVDLPAVVNALRAANYDGLYCIETDYLREDCPDEETAVEQSVAYLRALAAA